jgi:hypothetical protein
MIAPIIVGYEGDCTNPPTEARVPASVFQPAAFTTSKKSRVVILLSLPQRGRFAMAASNQVGTNGREPSAARRCRDQSNMAPGVRQGNAILGWINVEWRFELPRL